MVKLNKKGGLTANMPRSEKYRKSIIPLRKEKKPQRQEELETFGQGFLPSDPNALCERLELLMASKQAGNTGLRNENVIICDELLRQKILSRDAYKNLTLALNKDVNIARSAGQKVGQKAIDFASSKLAPKSQQILSKLVSSRPPLAPQGATPRKAQQVTTNLNNLIAGSGQ